MDIRALEFEIEGLGVRARGFLSLGLGLWSLGLRISEFGVLGFRVSGVLGLGFRGLGFWGWGF